MRDGRREHEDGPRDQRVDAAMPAFDAGDDERATWLELKAEVFAQIAAERRAVAAGADAYMAARDHVVDPRRFGNGPTVSPALTGEG
jgi:hypothetical protein